MALAADELGILVTDQASTEHQIATLLGGRRLRTGQAVHDGDGVACTAPGAWRQDALRLDAGILQRPRDSSRVAFACDGLHHRQLTDKKACI
jgi:hypothetical protein